MSGPALHRAMRGSSRMVAAAAGCWQRWVLALEGVVSTVCCQHCSVKVLAVHVMVLAGMPHTAEAWSAGCLCSIFCSNVVFFVKP